MSRRFALLFVALGACATQDVAVSSGKARFTEYPDTLFAAFKSACEGPAQSFNRPAPDLVECREYLPPQTTAAIIVNFDGTPEDLPELVIRFRAEQQEPGYLVENDVFLNVPQREGNPVQVRMPDPKLSRTLDALYVRAGGVPVAVE